MDRVVDPIVADLQTEHDDAVRAGRRWRAAWIRISGYSAFWKAVGLHAMQSGPRSITNGIAADGWVIGRTMAYAFVAFVVVTLLLTAPPMIELYARTEHWLQLALFVLPQAMVLGIAIGLSLGTVCGASGIGRAATRIRGVLTLAAVATLLALASVLTSGCRSAYRVVVAQELGTRGVTKYSLPRGANEMSFWGLATGGGEVPGRWFPGTGPAVQADVPPSRGAACRDLRAQSGRAGYLRHGAMAASSGWSHCSPRSACPTWR